MKDLHFEPIEERHLDAIIALEHRLFSSPWTRGMFEQEIGANDLSWSHAVTRDGELIAYVITWILRHEVHLLNIAVAPEYQRRGVGTMLVRFVIDEARRRRRELVTLEVRVGNAAARRLYERHGFETVALRKNYYQDDHEDAVVMVLRVDDMQQLNGATGND